MKKSLLFGILILTISLFTNCQKENIDELEIKTSKTLPQLKAVVSDGGKLIKNNRNLNKHLNTFTNKKNNIQARTVTSIEYGFSIDTTRIQQIETTSYKSYTFIVERENYDETILENYVYTIYNDSTATQYIINYPLNTYSEFDIANASIQSINDSSLIYSKGSDCQGYAAIVEYQEPVCTDNYCNEGGNHSPGEACDDGEYRATRTCTQGGWVEVGCSGGSETSSNANGDYNPDNQTTSGNGNNNSGETPEVIETVIVPLPIDYQQEIENCINGLTIIGQTDNTTIDSSLLDQLNNRQKAEINNYLQGNSCSEEAQELAVLAAEAVVNDGEVDFENEIIYFVGDKPLEEFDNKCDGVERIWQLSQLNGDEYAGVLTTDGAVLITQQLNPNGGGISGIYNHNGNTYYQYPTSQGAPSRTYAGQIIVSGRYFIPIASSIHSHTPCLNDGTDGISSNIINDDQAFANHYPNINHYIIGCNAIGQFNGSSNQAFNISNGSLNSICNNVN